MTNQSINEYLTEDHNHLDILLEGFQEWKPKDLAKAKDFLSQFVSALRRHLQWEETILFPLFEQKSRSPTPAAVGGPHSACPSEP